MMMTVGQKSQQIQMSNMHNLKFKDQIMPNHETDSKSHLSDPKYPQNYKNWQSYGSKVCKAHLQHDDHLVFEGLNRV